LFPEKKAATIFESFGKDILSFLFQIPREKKRCCRQWLLHSSHFRTLLAATKFEIVSKKKCGLAAKKVLLG
jgi:hypothetical protein